MLAPEEADPTRRASNEQPSEDVMSIIQVRRCVQYSRTRAG
jgi:hypothetical protein